MMLQIFFKIFFEEIRNVLFFVFALKILFLPRKIVQQCGLYPAKLWSNADFAPQNQGPFVLCSAKSRRLCSLLRGIMEQCRLCPAKSWRHNFRRQQISINQIFFLFFLFIFVNQCHFRYIYNTLDYFTLEKYFVSRYLQAQFYPKLFWPIRLITAFSRQNRTIWQNCSNF